MVSLLFVQQQHRAIVATRWSSTASVLSFVCTTRSQKSGEQNLDGDVMSEQESVSLCHCLQEVAVSSRQAHSQGFETTGEGEKFEVLSSTGFATRELRKDSLESTGVKEILELKQFASDFLSLYCRLLSSEVSATINRLDITHKFKSIILTQLKKDEEKKLQSIV
nr:helicase and polymerase-containing protein TEBICHI isoform X1 [Ipomoea batatas]